MRPDMIVEQPIWLAGLMIASLAILGATAVELLVRRAIRSQVRQEHTVVASAMFTVIGTTYAVLLAFVAMLALEGFNKAQAATDAEASLVQAVHQLVSGLSGPEAESMDHDIAAYAHAVVAVEWPLLARGVTVAEEQPGLTHLTRTAMRLQPNTIANGNLHALLLDELTRLASARRERLFAQRPTVPGIVWFVLVAGGGITITFGSFLGAPNLGMQLGMAAMLATSGALVLLVIVALSNPFQGDFRISADPYARVLTRMGS